MGRKLQLLRNELIYTPVNGASAKDTAKASVLLDTANMSMKDGEVVGVRYQEENQSIKSMLGIYHDIGPDAGFTYLDPDPYDDTALRNWALQTFMRKPVTLYETDGTTGILGVNNQTLGENWQLTDLDFSPYKYAKCYFKISDFPNSSNYLTPSMVIVVPLDEASRSKGVNDTISSGKVPCDMYIAGGAAINPSDRNVLFLILVAIDTTKTKFQVVTQNSIYGTALGGRNDNGRYLYKIEGCFD